MKTSVTDSPETMTENHDAYSRGSDDRVQLAGDVLHWTKPIFVDARIHTQEMRDKGALEPNPQARVIQFPGPQK